MQGESDAGDEITVQRYQVNLKRMMDFIRAALRKDVIPVVIGQISEFGKDDYQKVQANGKVWAGKLTSRLLPIAQAGGKE